MQEKYLNKSVIIQWKIKRKNINKKKKNPNNTRR